MGLEAAKFMDPAKIIVISGRTESKLEKAKAELEKAGHKTYIKTCDTSDRKSVKELVKFAKDLGEITNVLNCAGVSPAMKLRPEVIIRINALGTVHVNQEFAKAMKKGSVILDVASMAAYQAPKFVIPRKVFPLAETDEELFVKKMAKRTKLMKNDYLKSGMAYLFSKNFVAWYAAKCAFDFGKKGIRVCSVSPGLIMTPMGKLEEENSKDLLKYSAEKRAGRPEELGFAIATLADERNSYLAGIDVLVDGGTIRGMKEFQKDA